MDTVICGPESGLVALCNKFPKIVFDITGAGDHLPEIDTKIRRVKKLYRCVKSDLHWRIPRFLVGDLVKYSVSKVNVRRTKALESNICPRVGLTGCKINYQKEFGLGFRDYAEVKTNQTICNNNEERSEPCMALYPAMKLASSWVFWNINSKKRIRRSNYKYFKTTELIIAMINALSNQNEVALVSQEGSAEQI